MAKSKTPSPQEQHRARRAREERERSALLPPGLPNHGNTCFMNSVLQALIATHDLHLLVRFLPVPLPTQRPAVPVASRRSPVLTNGHGLAGVHDQPWCDALPIGDHLVAVLHAAWDIQYNRKRETVSPKDLLAALGKKYDQYLDFRQQDAHEFLCQLLDAVRMEEMDVIKQRSPPKKTGRRTQPSRHPAPPPDDALFSLVDMLFSGTLTSILVCQACKHVSQTYEDFSDLSLSMKPEDYVRERKRDRLKQFAKKIGTAFYVAAPQPRSSSVPATPVRTSNLDSPERTDSQRRRSIDLADVEIAVEPVEHKPEPGREDSAPPVAPSPVPPDTPSVPSTPRDPIQPPVPATDYLLPTPHVPEPSGDHVTIVAPEKANGKERKDKDESWAKISRRISVSVGLARKPKSERKDMKPTTPALPLKGGDESNVVSMDPIIGAVPQPERELTSLSIVNEKLQAQLTSVKRSVMPTPRSGNSPLGTTTPRFRRISRPSSPVTQSKSVKPPRPPKPSAEEAAYLRDILADINPPNVQKPFSIFKQSKDPSSTLAPNSIFLKVNQITRIEECLRLFTSVEVLDGENTVRCHRCWKIANGYYKHETRGSAQDPDSCTDSEDDEAVDDKKDPGDRLSPNLIPVRMLPSSSRPASASHSTTSLQDTQIPRDTPSTLTQPATRTPKHAPPALQLNDGYPIELVSPVREDTPTQRALAVPTVPTVLPESPMSVQTAKPAPARGNTMSSQIAELTTRLPLGTPSDPHRHAFRSENSSNTESELSEGESETLLSVYSDVSSAPSTTPSPSASQEHLQQPSASSPSPSVRGKGQQQHPSGVPRSRQYVPRPAYKRYLIATPPPVLIVHLKRFQQLSRTPVVSFSTGFKKLDDYIAFPEHLDLAPYLAPRREDYFDSKVAVTRGRVRRPAPCMYQLYAVVVHIGNMLGGHYVAYTALPPIPPSSSSETEPGRPETERPRSDTASPRDWAFISDTHVRLASLEEVLKSKAYVCMYERI